ncbi:glutaredoxin family protein [bacterium]|nr:glutaredoxin family protein [bacterium]
MSGRVTFITRVGCSICDDAEPMVRSWADRIGVEVDTVDVDREGLADRFGDMVPVVLGPDDDVMAWGRINAFRLMIGLIGVRMGVGGDS